MRPVFTTILVLFLVSCSGDQCRRSALEARPIKLNIERLDHELFEAKTVEDVATLLSEHRTLANLFLHAQQYPDISILAKRFFELTQDPHIDTLSSPIK